MSYVIAKPALAPIVGEYLLTRRDVVRRLALSARTLSRMIDTGRFPAPDFRFTPSTPRWKASTVSAFFGVSSK